MSEGPDQGFAWVVAIACFFINFIVVGFTRTVGVLYVALIDLYGVSREAAAKPFTIRFFVTNIAGPLVGLLEVKYGIQRVTAFGGFFAAVGSILCCFSPNIFWVNIFWGLIHGIGFGLSALLHMLTINKHFDKFRATALGFGYSGDCFGNFVFLIFIDYLLATIGVEGTFLIMGGIFMNVVPCALLLREPTWIRHARKEKIELKGSAMEETNTGISIVERQKFTNKGFESSEIFKSYNESEAVQQIQSKQNQLYAISTPHGDNSAFKGDLKGEHNKVFNSAEIDMDVLAKEKNESKIQNVSPTCVSLSFDHCSSATVKTIPMPNLNGKIEKKGTVYSSLSSDKRSVDIFTENKKLQQNSFEIIKTDKESDDRQNTDELDKSGSHLKNEFPTNIKTRNSYYEKQECRDSKKCIPLQKVVNEIVNNSSVNNVKNSLETKSEQNAECVNYTDLGTTESFQDKTMLKYNVSKPRRCAIGIEAPQSIMLTLIHTNINPMFILMCITSATSAFLLIGILTIIIDYASDQGIPKHKGKYLIVGFSITDLIARIALGRVIDKKLLKMKNYACSTITLAGLISIIIPLSSSFEYLMLCMCLYGLVQGGTEIMFPILLDTYMDKSTHSIALGCIYFHSAIVMLLLPPAIGFFRDNKGSYNSLFYIIGGIVTFVGLLWQFEPVILKFQNKKVIEK